MSRTLAAKLAQIEPGTLFAGVDLAWDRNVTLVLDSQARQLHRCSFGNDADSYTYFHQCLETVRQRHAAPAVWVGMEPTNYFWKLLAADLERRHVPYRLVNSYTVKKRREGDQLSRAKDDDRDAFTIADLLRTGKFTPTQLLHGGYAELRQYVGLRERLQDDIRRQRSRIWHFTGQLFPELTTEFKDLTGLTALALLRQHGAAAKIQDLSCADFIAAVRANFPGQRLEVAKLRRAHRLAQHSVGLREGAPALQMALRVHIETFQATQRHLAATETSLLDTFFALPEAPYLLSMANLGPLTAATILAEIGDPSRYTNARQLIKLAGTQPVPHLSGSKTRSQTPMSRQGRARLRTTLYFAVLRLVQHDANFARIYRRFQERDQNPLTKMQALGALMNKLLRILWALMKHQTFYDPTYELRA
jgi:transposase